MQTAQREFRTFSPSVCVKRFRNCSFGQRLAARSLLRCGSACTVRMPDPEREALHFPSGDFWHRTTYTRDNSRHTLISAEEIRKCQTKSGSKHLKTAEE